MGCGASRKVVSEPPGLARVKLGGQSQDSVGGAPPGPEAVALAAQRMQVAHFRAKFDSRVLAR
jgi:protein serine kinase H